MAVEISKKDRDALAEKIREDYGDRKRSEYRKKHERVWEVVDKQIAMEAPRAANRSGNKDEDWHSAIQLGLLADASEIITADTMRLLLPNDRQWFQPHSELGEVDPREQKVRDGLLRSLMAQQHLDFGFKDRIKLGIKECLHHGGGVVTVDMESMTRFHSGVSPEQLKAPVFRVHSMWNAFPDPSPYIQGTELIYRGAMIVRWYMTLEQVKRQKGWIDLKRVEDKASQEPGKEVEIICFYGDTSVPRSRDDIFLPNRKTILANDVLVYSERNKTPYSPVIYFGYERDDVRDPYYSSPLIKRSPVHELATITANRFVDSVWLNTEPPIVYDELDSHMRQSGGPEIYPGARNPSRNAANGVNQIQIGQPDVALQGYLSLKESVEKGTGINAVRETAGNNVPMKAAEVHANDQRSEIRTVDFVAGLERKALRPFLYMQHYLNVQGLENYPFYNSEVNTPDFLRASRSDLPKAAHFEIVGSKSVLGEEKRAAMVVNTAQLAASIPQVAQLTDWSEVTQTMWTLTGEKDPDRFVVQENDPTAAIRAQFEQQMTQFQEEMQKLQVSEAQHKIEKQQWQFEREYSRKQLQDMQEQATFQQNINKANQDLAQKENRILEEQLQLQARADSVEDERQKLELIKKDMEYMAKELDLQKREAGVEIARRDMAVREKAGKDTSQVEKTVQEMQEAERRKQQLLLDFFRAKGMDDAVQLIEAVRNGED